MKRKRFHIRNSIDAYKNNKKSEKRMRSLDLSLNSNVKGNNTKDDTNMFVTPSAIHGNRLKKLFCMFSGKFQSKFARHLKHVHIDVDEVKIFTILPKGCNEIIKLIHAIKKSQ